MQTRGDRAIDTQFAQGRLLELADDVSAWRESGAGDGNHQETGCATSRTPRAAQTRDTVSNRG